MNLKSSQINCDQNKNVFSNRIPNAAAPHVLRQRPGGAPAHARPPAPVSLQNCKTRFEGKWPFSSGRAALGLHWAQQFPLCRHQRAKGVLWAPRVQASSAQTPPASVRPLLSLTRQGVMSRTSGKFPDEYSVLVSKIKHKFFSEENLYGLWNLVRCLLDACTSISLLLYSLSSLRMAALSAADSRVQGLSARLS